MAVAGKQGRIDWCCVTGMARSGTTFVGDMLALPWRTVYLHEPFSPLGIQGVDWLNTDLLGDALQPADESATKIITDFLRLRGRYGNQVPSGDPLVRRTLKRIIGGRGRVAWRTGKCVSYVARRGVVKDPFAWCFSPWLHHAHGVKVIAVVKHPVSQVASYARAGWRASVRSILGRPALLAQLEASDREALIDPSCSDAIAAARQWRWQYRLLGQWAGHLGWPVVKIEDISEDPHTQFAKLFDSIGWPIPSNLAPAIARRTGAGNPAEARPGRFQDLNRDSKAIFAMRRASVPVEVRRAIFYETFEVAKHWYDEASYRLDEEAA